MVTSWLAFTPIGIEFASNRLPPHPKQHTHFGLLRPTGPAAAISHRQSAGTIATACLQESCGKGKIQALSDAPIPVVCKQHHLQGQSRTLPERKLALQLKRTRLEDSGPIQQRLSRASLMGLAELFSCFAGGNSKVGSALAGDRDSCIVPGDIAMQRAVRP